MSQTLIKAEGVWKKYAQTFSGAMRYGASDMMKIAFGREPSPELRKHEFWAVSNASFELKRGETLGLIGHNGAGKTSLLKTVTGLLRPDRGHVRIDGRISWLVDLNAGLDPALTGRENVHLRADLLELSRGDAASLAGKVIDFAEIGEFMDSPVQYYSSGMRARVGFAIAAMSRPDILVIDETLAVGDLSFRLKCYDLISDISKDASVIFVSHGMNHISRVCSQVMMLHKGQVIHYGDVQKGIQLYQDNQSQDLRQAQPGFNSHQISLECTSASGQSKVDFQHGEACSVDIACSIDADKYIQIVVWDTSDSAVLSIDSRYGELESGLDGERIIAGPFPLALKPGRYSLTAMASCARSGRHLAISNRVPIKVHGSYLSDIPVQIATQWARRPDYSPEAEVA